MARRTENRLRVFVRVRSANASRAAKEYRFMTLGLLLWMAALMPQPVHEQACLAATVYLEARDQSMLG